MLRRQFLLVGIRVPVHLRDTWQAFAFFLAQEAHRQLQHHKRQRQLIDRKLRAIIGEAICLIQVIRFFLIPLPFAGKDLVEAEIDRIMGGFQALGTGAMRYGRQSALQVQLSVIQRTAAFHPDRVKGDDFPHDILRLNVLRVGEGKCLSRASQSICNVKLHNHSPIRQRATLYLSAAVMSMPA